MLASCAVEVKFHNWDNYECIGSVSSPDQKAKGFLDISWCCDGKHLVAVPLSGKSLVVSLHKPKHSSAIFQEPWKCSKESINKFGIKCATFSKLYNNNVLYGTISGGVQLYDIYKKNTIRNFENLPSSVNFVEYGAQDRYIAAACGNGPIYIYSSEVDSSNVTSVYNVPCGNDITKISTHPKLTHLLAGGGHKGLAAVWDINSGTNIFKSRNHAGNITGMSFSLTDDTFITIGIDQKLNIHDLRIKECVHEKQFDSDLTAIAHNPNGMDIAVATGRGQILCLDKRYLHTCKAKLKAHKYMIKKLSFDLLNSNYYEDDDAQSSAMSAEVKPCAFGDSRSGSSNLRIVDEQYLNKFREEMNRGRREILSEMVETVNLEFLKLRLDLSREFCTTEIRNKTRWHEFNTNLTKYADTDDEPEASEGSFVTGKLPTVVSQSRTKSQSNYGYKSMSNNKL